MDEDKLETCIRAFKTNDAITIAPSDCHAESPFICAQFDDMESANDVTEATTDDIRYSIIATAPTVKYNPPYRSRPEIHTDSYDEPSSDTGNCNAFFSRLHSS